MPTTGDPAGSVVSLQASNRSSRCQGGLLHYNYFPLQKRSSPGDLRREDEQVIELFQAVNVKNNAFTAAPVGCRCDRVYDIDDRRDAFHDAEGFVILRKKFYRKSRCSTRHGQQGKCAGSKFRVGSVAIMIACFGCWSAEVKFRAN